MPTPHSSSSTQQTGAFRPRSLSVASIVQASVEEDLDNEFEHDAENDVSSRPLIDLSQISLDTSYRRPSIVATGTRPVVLPFVGITTDLSVREQEDILKQERKLLEDNHILSSKTSHGDGSNQRRTQTLSNPFKASSSKVSGRTSSNGENADAGRHGGQDTTEDTPLLGSQRKSSTTVADDPDAISSKWEEAVISGMIKTTWQREAKVLAGYTAPLMATFILQYSLTMASIFTVGRLGTVELGAVSLASMSANISGYAIYQGLSVSLDTLCAQAYGSGHKTLVGLQMQRMVFLLWLVTVPIGAIWLLSDKILHHLVPEADVAILAGRYLKVLLLGAPGYACFEAGKRFVQAQGIFTASLYVLCICAPLNAFLNWFFVWQLGWGFIGAPIAVAITDNLLPLGLYIYVRFYSDNGMECWDGFTTRAFSNWLPMIKLAVPGLVMIEAEILASEILTLLSSYFGVTYLAANSVLATITALAFQVPFPLAIAGSTRIANLIGATLGDAARTATKVAMSAGVLVAGVNATLLLCLRCQIPSLFSHEQEVIEIVASVIPICAAFQLFDSLGAVSNGVLRGLGRQEIGAYIQLLSYYAVGLPFAVFSAFSLKWRLHGLWAGNALALALVTVIEAVLLSRISYQSAVDQARKRNILG